MGQTYGCDFFSTKEHRRTFQHKKGKGLVNKTSPSPK